MIIAITGTPGTGKTTIAKWLAVNIGYDLVDIDKLLEIYPNIKSGFDEEMDANIIDLDKLNKAFDDYINSYNKHNIVFDSHLSHYIDKKNVHLVIITHCELQELKKRLVERGYSEKKIRENIDAEIFDVCKTEAQENGHDYFMEINTTNSSKTAYMRLKKAIKSKFRYMF
jgi:adenylate kinase